MLLHHTWFAEVFRGKASVTGDTCEVDVHALERAFMQGTGIFHACGRGKRINKNMHVGLCFCAGTWDFLDELCACAEMQEIVCMGVCADA